MSAKSQSTELPACVTPPAQGSLTVTVHTIDEKTFTRVSNEFQTWQKLFDRDPCACILQHPEVVLTELRHQGRSRPGPPVFIQCDRGAETVAVAILVPKSTGGEKKFGPLWSLNGYRLAGNRLLGHPTVEEQTQVLIEVARVLKSSRADFLLVENIESSDGFLSLVAGNLHGLTLFRPDQAQRRLKIELPKSIDDYYAGFSSKSRGTLRRKARLFGECRLERIDRPDQVADFLRESSKISANSWQHDLLGERIASDSSQLELLTALAIESALRSYLLWKADTPVSFVIATQYKGVLMFEETAYDRKFAKESPGQVLLMKMLEDLFEHDRPRVFDFGGGDADYKRKFGNVESESGNIWLLPPGFRSRVIVAYLRSRRSLNRCLRSVLAKTGLLKLVRRKTRRGIRN